MSEEQEQPVASTAESAPEGPLGGERLAAARREQQISVHEVAKELHLDEAKVRALEANEFDVLGAPVFAKGHLRKYAQLVGVDEDDVFADYYKMTHTADLPPVISVRPKIRREISPGPWIAAAIVLIAAAIAYWWFVARPVTPVVEPSPAAAPGAEVADAVPLPEPAESIVTVAQSPEEAVVSEAEPLAVDDGLTRITLNFSGDCWTEITDANGQRLFFDMGRAGRSVELSGTAPFDVLFGNAENVSVRVNGNDYPVLPANPGSRTARLTILSP
jgi:cytoskeleton protein RodZ